MLRFLALSVWIAVAYAQAPEDLFNKPPADVDATLRERITEFFQDHVDGKFRQAEALVAEDTKDFFYSANKPKYQSFEIKQIAYSEGFTRAHATVVCEQFVLIPGFTDKPLKVPVPSNWKLVDGKWYWYVDQEALKRTPFGAMNPGGGKGLGDIKIPSANEMRFIFTQVKPDKQSVSLKPGGSDQVTLTNTAQGPMSIALMGAVHGVVVSLDRMDLKAGEKSVLTFRAGADPKPGVLSVRIEQTNQVIPIQVGIQ